MALPKIYGDFICRKCGCETDRLEYCTEPHGELVPYDRCSCCGGRYEAAVECPECKQAFAESKLVDYEGEQVCETCREMLKAQDELEEAS